ncbi:basic proline-rich protein [Gracilaria domingensis]|nr:basic proline-rich protein [Gracilaria domingensis]
MESADCDVEVIVVASRAAAVELDERVGGRESESGCDGWKRKLSERDECSRRLFILWLRTPRREKRPSDTGESLGDRSGSASRRAAVVGAAESEQVTAGMAGLGGGERTGGKRLGGGRREGELGGGGGEEKVGGVDLEGGGLGGDAVLRVGGGEGVLGGARGAGLGAKAVDEV